MEQFDFTAWSLYTGPSYLKTVIDDPDCPWVVGQWDGVNQDTSAPEIKKDLDQRIQLVVATFQQALGSWRTYNRHFAIPEFFFHCKEGPYPNIKVDGQHNPFDYIITQLTSQLQALIPKDNNYYNIVLGSVLTSNIADYAAFLASAAVVERQKQLNAILPKGGHRALKPVGHPHVPWRRTPTPGAHTGVPRGRHTRVPAAAVDKSDDLTALNSFMTVARGNPLCGVRNRGAFITFNKTMMPAPEVYIYEKQYESTVDLTMGMYDSNGQLTPMGMITEWIGNYTSYSILSGDKQTSKPSNAARFTPAFAGYSDYGVEICLDHRLQRLRRTVDMCIANGAAADNFPLFKQLIPSGGMQLLDYSVAAGKNSAIFNADGCDKIYYVYTDPNSYILNGESGTFTGITCGVYNKSVQSKWTGRDGNTYYSHSQLAFTTNDSSIDGFNNALGLENAKAKTYYGSAQQPFNPLTDDFAPQVTALGAAPPLFACNTGELDYYQPK
jgi:hypothetical protein